MGGPVHHPTDVTRRIVERGAAHGIKQSTIASMLNIDEKTLRDRYREELDEGLSRTLFAIAESLTETALDRNNPKSITAAIFYLKTRGRWREEAPSTAETQVVDPDPDL